MPKLEQIRKAVVAFLGANGAATAAVATGDFSTWQGIVAFVIAELIAFGVYKVPNAPH